MRLVTAAQMREVEERTIGDLGLPGLLLMENAGRAVAEAACVHLQAVIRRRVLVIGGKGNNGGDGWVAARHLLGAGFSVQLLLLGDRASVGGDAGVNLSILEKMGSPLSSLVPGSDLSPLEAALANTDLVVDAILGIGIRGPVGDWLGEAISRINDAHVSVLAVDIPSGLCADTGNVLGKAIHATWTITLGLPKPGLYTGEGPDWAGRVTVADISLPVEVLQKFNHPWELLERDLVRGFLPPLKPSQHKGDRGTLLLLAGSKNMTGAAILAARAACRSGVGKVVLGLPQSCQAQVAASIPTCLTWGLPEEEGGVLAGAALEEIFSALPGFDAVAAGPGLTASGGVSRIVGGLVRGCPVPLVLDADALNVLAEDSRFLAQAASPVTITPHPGEMGRLLGWPIQEIQKDRLAAAGHGAKEWQTTVLLKGAGTVIASPAGKGYLNPTGNHGLASAGTGDCLTGLLGGLLAQGAKGPAAASAAAYLHGLAADLAAEEIPPISMTAEDVITYIPKALRLVESA